MRKSSRKYHLIKALIMPCLVLVFVLQFTPRTALAAPLVQSNVAGTENYARAWEILDLVNIERANELLPPLTMDTGLLDYAMLRSAETVVLFSHTRPDGTAAIDAILSGTRGENIAAGHTSAATVVDAWMNSPGHRANILNPSYTGIGVGAYLSNGRYYYTQLFFGSTSVEPVRNNVQVPKTHAVDINVATARTKIKAASVPTYNLNAGDIQALNLPNIFLEIYRDDLTTLWSQIDIEFADLAYTIADTSVATIVGTDLQTANLQAVGAGSTTLNVFVAGLPSKAVTFNIAIAPSAHTHTYTSTVTAPTCVDAGYTEHACNSCPNKYRDSITPPTGHTHAITETVVATCTTAGHTTHTCNDCPDTYQTTLAILPHNDTSTIVAATCTVDGYTEHVCDDCGRIHRDSIVTASGHNFTVTDTVLAPSPCMPGGYTEHTCGVCFEVDQVPLTVAAHNYVSTTTPKTCTTDGYTEHVCNDCGNNYRDNIVAASHDYVSTVTAPTCTTDGYTRHVCNDCPNIYQDNIVAAAHDYQGTVKLAPTCTVDGIMAHECTVCTDKAPDTIIAALGHTFSAWTVVSEDATTQTEERVCAIDGSVETRQVAKASANPAGGGQTGTGAVTSSTNQQENGVNAGGKAAKTGDSATIIPLAIGGLSALFVIGFVLVKNVSRKNK